MNPVFAAVQAADENLFLLTVKDLVENFSLSDFFSPEMYLDSLREDFVLWAVFIFWVGCNIGSFLNVCIYRLPLGMSLLRPGSHCPKCGHKLGISENIPIFAYLFLRGKCKKCRDTISPRYLIVESFVGLLFCLIYLKVHACGEFYFNLLLYFYAASIAVVAAFTDCETRIIPNRLTYPALIVAPLFYLLKSRICEPFCWDFRQMIVSLASAVILWGLLDLFARAGKRIFRREAFGGGDVKLMAAAAACFGLFPALLILLGACFSAVICVSLYRMIRPARKHRGFPFGPFISFLILIWIFFWNGILPYVLKLYPASVSIFTLP